MRHALFPTRLFAVVLGLGVLFALVAPSAMAQEREANAAAGPVAPDYVLWESVASRAEATLDEATDSNEVLETLRGRLDTFRQTFAAARNVNSGRIQTLRAQIDALGPAPAEGETEAADIADRRASLNQQLTQALAPQQAAQEAFTRADGLIDQIDTILRDRETERLLSLGPSPMNPAIWPIAVEEFVQAIGQIAAEARVFQDRTHLERAREDLPLTLLLLAVGMILIIRGRVWAARLGHWFRQLGGRGSGVWTFIVSLLRIGLPLAGLYVLSAALLSTELFGLRGIEILSNLPAWGLLVLGFRWLAEQLFRRNDEDAVLPLRPERRREAKFYVTLLGVLIALRQLLGVIIDFSGMSRDAQAVMAFGPDILTAATLFRLGQILRGYRRGASEEEAVEELGLSGQGLSRLIRIGGVSAQVVAVVAPVLTAVGYSAAGEALLNPMILSLALLGLIMIVQRFLGAVYAAITGQEVRDAGESLWVVMLSFVLILVAAPLFALIWGGRVTDLLELWNGFLEGFSIGETRISPVDFLTFIIVFGAGFLLTRLLQSALRTQVLPKTRIDMGGRNALLSGVGYIGIFLAAVIAITTAGIDLSGLAIVAGALSVGLGFGLQNIVSNFVSGIILLIERPISEGDWIEVGGVHGTVRDISVRSTRVETFDRSDVIVPNSEFISGRVTNYTRGNTVGRVIVPVGVAYGTDTRRVEAILREIAEAHPLVLANPMIVFVGFGASSLDFEIRAILRDVNFMIATRTEMNHQIAQRFTEEGIEIPFPQQDVWLRRPPGTPPPPPHHMAAEHNPPDEGEQSPAGEGGA